MNRLYTEIEDSRHNLTINRPIDYRYEHTHENQQEGRNGSNKEGQDQEDDRGVENKSYVYPLLTLSAIYDLSSERLTRNLTDIVQLLTKLQYQHQQNLNDGDAKPISITLAEFAHVDRQILLIHKEISERNRIRESTESKTKKNDITSRQLPEIPTKRPSRYPLSNPSPSRIVSSPKSRPSKSPSKIDKSSKNPFLLTVESRVTSVAHKAYVVRTPEEIWAQRQPAIIGISPLQHRRSPFRDFKPKQDKALAVEKKRKAQKKEIARKIRLLNQHKVQRNLKKRTQEKPPWMEIAVTNANNTASKSSHVNSKPNKLQRVQNGDSPSPTLTKNTVAVSGNDQGYATLTPKDEHNLRETPNCQISIVSELQSPVLLETLPDIPGDMQSTRDPTSSSDTIRSSDSLDEKSTGIEFPETPIMDSNLSNQTAQRDIEPNSSKEDELNSCSTLTSTTSTLRNQEDLEKQQEILEYFDLAPQLSTQTPSTFNSAIFSNLDNAKVAISILSAPTSNPLAWSDRASIASITSASFDVQQIHEQTSEREITSTWTLDNSTKNQNSHSLNHSENPNQTEIQPSDVSRPVTPIEPNVLQSIYPVVQHTSSIQRRVSLPSPIGNAGNKGVCKRPQTEKKTHPTKQDFPGKLQQDSYTFASLKKAVESKLAISEPSRITSVFPTFDSIFSIQWTQKLIPNTSLTPVSTLSIIHTLEQMEKFKLVHQTGLFGNSPALEINSFEISDDFDKKLQLLQAQIRMFSPIEIFAMKEVAKLRSLIFKLCTAANNNLRKSLNMVDSCQKVFCVTKEKDEVVQVLELALLGTNANHTNKQNWLQTPFIHTDQLLNPGRQSSTASYNSISSRSPYPTSSFYNLLWTWRSPSSSLFTSLMTFQKVNHFPLSKNLTRKDLLQKHIKRFALLPHPGQPSDYWSILPQTFILPRESAAFVAAYTTSSSSLPTDEVRNLWIVKPPCLSRGRGIRVISSLTEVDYGEPIVVQRYITNPLLVSNHKFDLRLYVLVTSFAPLEAFIYTEGFARISLLPFSLEFDDLSNRLIHLTNSSIQKQHLNDNSNAVSAAVYWSESNDLPFDLPPNSIAGGTKITLETLRQLLNLDSKQWAVIWEQIRVVVLKALITTEDEIGKEGKPNSFELFGFDILIDDLLKPWLLEVNSSPSMNLDTPLDRYLKPKLIRDAINLVAPLPFDRNLLASLCLRRLITSKSQVQESELRKLFCDQLPREYGELPREVGLFERIAPGREYAGIMKCKRAASS